MKRWDAPIKRLRAQIKAWNTTVSPQQKRLHAARDRLFARRDTPVSKTTIGHRPSATDIPAIASHDFPTSKLKPMRVPFFHGNAFTGPGLSGNPAGVCVLDSWLDDDWLRKVAAENILSATAFLVTANGKHQSAGLHRAAK